MRTTFSFPIETLSGRSGIPGKLVFFNWRNIPCARTYVSPRNPESTGQEVIRGFMTQASQAFQSVTTAEKEAWEAYAALTPIKVGGRDIVLPAISVYVRVNMLRLINAAALTDTAPSALASFVATSFNTLAYVAGTTTLSFNVVHNLASISAEMWEIYITNTLPSGAYKPRKGDYRLAFGVDSKSIIDVTATPQTITDTAPKFTGYTDGDHVGVKLVPLSDDYDPGTVLEDVLTIAVT